MDPMCHVTWLSSTTPVESNFVAGQVLVVMVTGEYFGRGSPGERGLVVMETELVLPYISSTAYKGYTNTCNNNLDHTQCMTTCTCTCISTKSQPYAPNTGTNVLSLAPMYWYQCTQQPIRMGTTQMLITNDNF